MVIENQASRPLKGEHGHWLPGVSGNPLGRPPKALSPTERLRRRFNQEADVIIERTIQELATSPDFNVRLLEMVLNRIEGIPKQTLQIEGDSDSPYNLILGALAARMQVAERQGEYKAGNSSLPHPDAPSSGNLALPSGIETNDTPASAGQ